MNTLLRRLVLTASAVAALYCAAGASAQPVQSPEGGPGPARAAMGAHRMERMQHRHRMPTAADVAVMLDSQKAALALTAAQDPAWQNFAAVVRRHAEARDAQHLKMLTERDAELHAEMDALKAGTARAATPSVAASAAPSLTPADRAMHHASMMKLHEAQHAERDEALKGLLAVLTPAQKTQAETLLRRPHAGHRMMRGMHGMHGMGGMRGDGPDATAPAERPRS